MIDSYQPLVNNLVAGTINLRNRFNRFIVSFKGAGGKILSGFGHIKNTGFYACAFLIKSADLGPKLLNDVPAAESSAHWGQ